jgi:predicted SAM-dependent methyltransferase
MDKLNVGCGNKLHPDWVNVDMVSYSPEVKVVDLTKGIPFADNSFDVVYHSQVLEHIPKEKSEYFVRECYRVLKPNGIMRVVVPDLENIVDEYKRLLNENLENPTALTKANYEWIMLEMYDQSVRHYSGGLMAKFIRQPNLINEQYIVDRLGYVGSNLRNSNFKIAVSSLPLFKKAVRYVLNKVKSKLVLNYAEEVGTFRLDGEIHMWMYDRYSLGQLLKDCGFADIVKKTPFESDIPDWSEYKLDVKDGIVYDPTSLFMEARKKLQVVNSENQSELQSGASQT